MRRQSDPIRNCWYQMIARCTHQNHRKYALYGARGITVCLEWMWSFEQFANDMGPRPEGCSLERIDNDGHYEPSNCRWATAKEQANNRRNNKPITIYGRTQNIAQWADEWGVDQDTARNGIRRWMAGHRVALIENATASASRVILCQRGDTQTSP